MLRSVLPHRLSWVLFRGLTVFPLFSTFILTFIPSTIAQDVRPDVTVGTEVEESAAGFRVYGGSIQGQNLFHSFETLSPEATGLNFDLNHPSYGLSSQGVQRIFSRVTGSQSSRINGVFAIQGGQNPDFFLLNPNGILFGPNAQLQLRGSFIGTTAESIQFADGANFPAQSQQALPLLSLSIPTGLQMGKTSRAITVQGPGHQRRPGNLADVANSLRQPLEAKGLRVSAGNTLALIGREIEVKGGIIQATPIFEPTTGLPLGGVQLSLGAVEQGTVQFQPSIYGLQLDYADAIRYGDIRFRDRSLFDATGILPSQGEIVGKNITLEDASLLSLNSTGNQPDGGLRVNASENLSILSRDPAFPFASAILNLTLGSGKGADINLLANRLLIEGGAIANSTVGRGGGESGNIDIRVNQDIKLNGAKIDLELEGFASSAVISSSSIGNGNGGSIAINTKNLSLDSGGLILSSAFGSLGNSQASDSGSGGEIEIEAQESIRISGFDSLTSFTSGIASSTLTPGDAGIIDIMTRKLQLQAGGFIGTDSFSDGNAGNVSITATESIDISGVSNNVLALPSEISSSVDAEGGIILRNLFGGLLGLPVERQGNGGNVELATPRLAVRDRALISVLTDGSGRVGKLNITADQVLLEGQAVLSATSNTPLNLASEAVPKTALAEPEVDPNSNGPNFDPNFSIDLQVSQNLVLRNGSQINASAEGSGNSANIAIKTQNLIAVPQENSDIRADSRTGFGGNIQLDATSVLGIRVQPQPTAESDITASSQQGSQFSGAVELRQPQNRQGNRLTTLPSPLSDPSDRLVQSCAPGSNQLSITRRGRFNTSAPTHKNNASAQSALAQKWGDRGHMYEQAQQWQQAEYQSLRALQLAQKIQDPFQMYQWAWQLARISQVRWEATGQARLREDAIAYYQEALNALKTLRSELSRRDDAAEFSFRSSIEPVYRELVSLLLYQDESNAPDQAQLQASLDVIEALRLAEIDNFFQDACSTVTANSIQQLDPKAAVLYPILLADRLEVIVSLPDGTLHHYSSSINSNEVDQLTRQFKKELTIRSRKNYRETGQQLYSALIQPALEILHQAETETLVFVPDGSFKNIPIAALWAGQHHLIEQFNVAIAPGLELLDAQPSLSLGKEAIALGISQRRQGFSPLQHVPQELEEIQTLLPGEALLDEQFTSEKFRQSLLNNQAPIVHIATHGQFSSTAEDTFILAWDEQIHSQQLGELLRSREQQQTPTELLVLSACETAVGDERAALGLAGLVVRAGARSTLASLWNINDASTALLMQEFYRQLSQKALSKSAALRQAQLAMLESETYAHPYYWSAFVLLGNWQ